MATPHGAGYVHHDNVSNSRYFRRPSDEGWSHIANRGLLWTTHYSVPTVDGGTKRFTSQDKEGDPGCEKESSPKKSDQAHVIMHGGMTSQAANIDPPIVGDAAQVAATIAAKSAYADADAQNSNGPPTVVGNGMTVFGGGAEFEFVGGGNVNLAGRSNATLSGSVGVADAFSLLRSQPHSEPPTPAGIYPTITQLQNIWGSTLTLSDHMKVTFVDVSRLDQKTFIARI